MSEMSLCENDEREADKQQNENGTTPQVSVSRCAKEYHAKEYHAKVKEGQ